MGITVAKKKQPATSGKRVAVRTGVLQKIDKLRARYKQLRYVAGNGAPYNNETASVLGQVLEALAITGPVTPHRLVEEARAEASPLHNMFTWDDAAAANAYRLWEARHAINTLEVVLVGGDGDEVRCNAAFSVKHLAEEEEEDAPSRSYIPAKEALQNQEYRALIAKDAKSSLLAWLARYQEFSFPEFAEVTQAIRAL